MRKNLAAQIDRNITDNSAISQLPKKQSMIFILEVPTTYFRPNTWILYFLFLIRVKQIHEPCEKITLYW